MPELKERQKLLGQMSLLAYLANRENTSICPCCGWTSHEQGEWSFDEEELAPRCPDCGEFLYTPEGW